MDELVLRLIQVLGVPGLAIWCAYKLLDKWAAQFLEVHRQQANAIQGLAESVKVNQDGQKEVLMAVRVLAAKVEESVGWMKELSEQIKVGVSQS
ncbi:MAG TPA: hypothetical protein VHZ25_17880 [Acidobacteriaceae bacterium]|jgi:hypothetical protein|nr:hypothetical protein [Acidobacteriaceae bacterium]